MPNFNGQLNLNEVLTTVYNMIIKQIVHTTNVAGTFSSLVDRARVEGSLYGDTILYYDTDSLFPLDFVPDSEEQLNLLKTHRPPDPKCQAIKLDVFKYIPVTIDNYFSKRAFSTETVFSDFNSTVIKWLNDTKRIYDATTYNAHLGTAESNIGRQQDTVSLVSITEAATTADEESYNRLVAQTIAEHVANLLIDLSDVSRDFNDYGYVRSFDLDDIIVVWNSEWYNSITKLDLPTIFHKDELLDKFDRKNVLPARYFGTYTGSGTGTTTGTNTSIRAREATTKYGGKQLFAGDLLPNSTEYDGYDTYTENGDIICKIIHKDSLPYMSGFTAENVFLNVKNLSENHYLAFGHNTLEHLKGLPFITVKAVTA